MHSWDGRINRDRGNPDFIGPYTKGTQSAIEINVATDKLASLNESCSGCLPLRAFFLGKVAVDFVSGLISQDDAVAMVKLKVAGCEGPRSDVSNSYDAEPYCSATNHPKEQGLTLRSKASLETGITEF